MLKKDDTYFIDCDDSMLKKDDTYFIDCDDSEEPLEGNDRMHHGHTATVTSVDSASRHRDSNLVRVRCSCGITWMFEEEVEL